jgi:hypothetical protein
VAFILALLQSDMVKEQQSGGISYNLLPLMTTRLTESSCQLPAHAAIPLSR